MRRLAAAFVTCLAITAPAAKACDVALALTMDVSGSIDPLEFRVQMAGLANALNQPDVREALISAQAYVTMMQWSGTNRQRVTVPWTPILTHADIDRLAEAARSAPRAYRHFSTAIGDAVLAAAALHLQIAGRCKRSVIDLSGDGTSNEGIALSDAHNAIAASAITVNGLAIETDEPGLSEYFRREVIGGPGAFVETAIDFNDYERAIRRKLLREITAPLVENQDGSPLALARAD